MSIRETVLLAVLLVGVTHVASADTRDLTGEEILAVFKGATMYGRDLKNNKDVKARIGRDGSLSLTWSYESAKPYRLKGSWSVEGDKWCRTVASKYKCQAVIEDGGHYCFINDDSSKSSCYPKYRISKEN